VRAARRWRALEGNRALISACSGLALEGLTVPLKDRTWIASPRRAALTGLLVGAAIWNAATLWQVTGRMWFGTRAAAPAGPAAGCTALALDRPTGRTVAWPCRERTWWLESALVVRQLATTLAR
jgi:hypothetical protein